MLNLCIGAKCFQFITHLNNVFYNTVCTQFALSTVIVNILHEQVYSVRFFFNLCDTVIMIN